MLRAGLVLVTVAACGGPPTAIEAPQSGPPRVQIVKCQAAVPAPRIPTQAYDFEERESGDVYGIGGGGMGMGTISVTARYPHVTIGTATATATIGDVSIRRFLRERIPQVRACYGVELAKDPALRGTLEVTFAIDAEGRVSGAKTTGVHPAVASCVTTAIAAIRFPRPPIATGRVAYPFVLASRDGLPPEPADAPTLQGPWTPYAILGEHELDVHRLETTSRAAEAVLRTRVPELEACFPRPALTGSLRAMIDVTGDGSVSGLRVGGLGELGVETCIGEVLLDIQLVVAQGAFAELACDLSRGDAQPWRVAPAAYARVEVTSKDVRFGDTSIVPDGADPDPLPGSQTYLVVARPDAPGALIELALVWAAEGDRTLLAIGDAERPLLIGEARNDASVDEAEDTTAAPHASLVVHGGIARACVERIEDTAPIADPAKLDAMLRRFAATCRKRECATTLGIAHDAATPLRELAAIATATRRAGFERVLFGAFSTCRMR